jgi:hypothetical protein
MRLLSVRPDHGGGNAKSITFTKEGTSGIYLAGLLQRLGIAEAIQPKIKPLLTGGRVAEFVAKGEGRARDRSHQRNFVLPRC